MSQRLHEAYGALPDGERRIADSLLGNPAELAVLTATELAAQAGTSNATVSRFFRRLGYDSFEQARQQARRMRATGSPLYTGNSAPASKRISDILKSEIDVLEGTLTRLNPVTLREIVQAMATAPRIRTLGYRNSHFLAQYVTAQLGQIRRAVSPLLLPGQTQAEGIALLTEGDLAVVIGLRRRPAGFNQVVEEIAARGARILLMADQTIREAPAHATWTIDCQVDTTQFADAYSGAMAVLRLLAIETRRALGSAGQSYLEEVEALRNRLQELE
ncbi:MurR/RpiR family transcriptional regulator [Salipiger sp. P9]|uniref:MurR/RpiR family transcriptional regulator n=1 Tax=Salipiger pentaromativorans TaxID=2943193 RepID=UPI00215751A9|nr:MurR/RpiR family transcriptional regulator [Salipiger pentaromativorans]MCR8547549.1 MurR/RpiR family transcriptional regulator [Salipiger pentaromativorans]